jgi:hypothetical protein
MKSWDFGKIKIKKRKTNSEGKIHKLKIVKKFWAVRQRSLSVMDYWLPGYTATYFCTPSSQTLIHAFIFNDIDLNHVFTEFNSSIYIRIILWFRLSVQSANLTLDRRQQSQTTKESYGFITPCRTCLREESRSNVLASYRMFQVKASPISVHYHPVV